MCLYKPASISRQAVRLLGPIAGDNQIKVFDSADKDLLLQIIFVLTVRLTVLTEVNMPTKGKSVWCHGKNNNIGLRSRAVQGVQLKVGL